MILGIVSGIVFGIVEFKNGPPAKTKITFGPLKESKLYIRETHVHYVWAAIAACGISTAIGAYDFAFFSGIMAIHGILPDASDPPEVEADEFENVEEPELIPEETPYDVSNDA